jgi:hypothetical protein
MSAELILTLLAGIVLGGFLFSLLSRITRNPIRSPIPTPRFNDRAAEGLLQKYGYQIIGKQPRRTVLTKFEGQNHLSYCEADYLVKKNKKTFLVMVHDGEGNFDPNAPDQRQRLLINDYVFSPDGNLFLSLTTGDLLPIEFEFPRSTNIDSFFQGLIIVFIILLVIGIICLMVWLKLF